MLDLVWCNLLYTTKPPLTCFSRNKTLTTGEMKCQATMITLSFNLLMKLLLTNVLCLVLNLKRLLLLKLALWLLNKRGSQITKALLLLNWIDLAWMGLKMQEQLLHLFTMLLWKTKRFKNKSRKKRWRSNFKEYLVTQIKVLQVKEQHLVELNQELLSKHNRRTKNRTSWKSLRKKELVGNCLRMNLKKCL